MGVAQSYLISPAYAFVTYTNRDSVSLRERYGIGKAETGARDRGMLLYQGVPRVCEGACGDGVVGCRGEGVVEGGRGWCRGGLVRVVVWAEDAKERYVTPCNLLDMCKVIDCVWLARSLRTSKRSASTSIISGLDWIGMFSDEKAEVRAGEPT